LWCTTIIPAFERWRQEDHKFEVSLGYIVRPCLKKVKKEVAVAEAYNPILATLKAEIRRIVV
jgi:hypothetical protein